MANLWSEQFKRAIAAARLSARHYNPIDVGVEYLIFPRYSDTFKIPKTFDEIQIAGRQAFERAFGVV